MKSLRHEKIYEIIKSKDVETQEELAEELRNEGINVTQATVSRDIKELNLMKILSHNGKYKYSAPNKAKNYNPNAMANMLSKTALTVEKIDKFLVVKTISASASLAAEALDSFELDGVAGTIAGDNTVLVITRSHEKAEEIVSLIKNLIHR
ncbi:arginine repressor [Clostridium argentinense CDC 2741]|uniref:Arginine repressor n=1 Tax=Clostridium argentinense CDC 2741 TaxID=1418104 RepID=A0A0C1RCP9_9CLOT|nr:arginine repressor [Clostridium argentinense]HAG43567.1 arginine repressor [Clostridium sp.]ARC85223.1 arginine repressor [Clostridium argentinense]KIE48141.1 arginine repressor [Clostridium argentinense CDC 2741]NFF39473.1 arginine repressor [Clostridium argentinense]NFP50980.1 arginine repressor [Clostridium argentinense]